MKPRKSVLTAAMYAGARLVLAHRQTAILRSALGVAVATAACHGGCGGSTSQPPIAEDCAAPPTTHTGKATYYAATGGGNCSFPVGGDLMVGAMNNTDYGNADWCGGCVQVTGPKGSAIVKIVDRCPECAPGDIDLSQQAFVKIADLAAGRVAISWQLAACPVSGPVVFAHKEGTSQYYTAIQVRNHRYPIAELAARAADGTWQALPRKIYNYYVPDKALGPGPYALRVTDVHGASLEASGVVLAPNAEVPGPGQFPSCAGE